MIRGVRCLAALAICTSAFGASAQQGEPASWKQASSVGPRNTLTINPLSALVGVVSLEYERATNDRLSLYVAPSYWSWSSQWLNDDYSFRAFGVGLGARYFLTGIAPEGFWFSPGVDLSFASAEWMGAEGTGVGLSIGAQLGYTWLVGDVFDISLGLGARYDRNQVEVKIPTGESRAGGFDGIYPTLRFALGVAF